MLAAPALVFAIGGAASAHDGAVPVRSTQPESGRLVAVATGAESFLVVATACASGQCLFTGSGPSFVAPSADAGPEGPFALKIATVVKMEVVSVDPGAAVKVGSSVLDAAGDSATLGAAWSLHADPLLQATAPQGSEREWTVVVRLVSSRYQASEPFPILFRNFEPASTTTTTSSTTTTLPAVCGDGAVDATEECDTGPAPWKPGRSCRADCTRLYCGDPDGNAKVTVADALFVLRVSVGVRACDDCLCNVDGSVTATAVSAADALRVLRSSVGAPGAALACPACS